MSFNFYFYNLFEMHTKNNNLKRFKYNFVFINTICTDKYNEIMPMLFNIGHARNMLSRILFFQKKKLLLSYSEGLMAAKLLTVI